MISDFFWRVTTVRDCGKTNMSGESSVKVEIDECYEVILLMEEILHHLTCMQPCSKWEHHCSMP